MILQDHLFLQMYNRNCSLFHNKCMFLTCILSAGSECNSSRLTFDGVDLMGDRLAEEVFFISIYML